MTNGISQARQNRNRERESSKGKSFVSCDGCCLSLCHKTKLLSVFIGNYRRLLRCVRGVHCGSVTQHEIVSGTLNLIGLNFRSHDDGHIFCPTCLQMYLLMCFLLDQYKYHLRVRRCLSLMQILDLDLDSYVDLGLVDGKTLLLKARRSSKQLLSKAI